MNAIEPKKWEGSQLTLVAIYLILTLEHRQHTKAAFSDLHRLQWRIAGFLKHFSVRAVSCIGIVKGGATR